MKRLNRENLNTPERYDIIFAKNKECGVAFMQNDREKKKRAIMSSYVKDGMKVVELGCGDSPLLGEIKNRYPNCEVHGLDFSPEIIKGASSKYPDVKYAIGNATKTDYPNGYFDYVMAGELIEHIEVPFELVKEMARICKKGGYLALSTPLSETMWREAPEEHIWEMNGDDMTNLLSAFGKAEIETTQDEFPHLIGICKKDVASNPYEAFPQLRDSKKIVANEIDIEFETIFEAGTQYGESLMAVKDKFPNAKMTGMDIDKNALSVAREKIPEATFLEADAAKTNFPSKSFDIVFTNAFLCMLKPEEVSKALHEIVRLAKKMVILVELNNSNTGEVIGGRTGANWKELIRLMGYESEIRKIKEEEWGVEPWKTYGYIIKIRL